MQCQCSAVQCSAVQSYKYFMPSTFLLPAIACHKFIIAFCVSMEMIEVKTKKFIFYSYLTVFSVTSAIGIAVGIIITEAGSGTVPEVVNATLQGM